MQSDESKFTRRRHIWLLESTDEALNVLSGGNVREAAGIMRAGIVAEIARRQAVAPRVDTLTAQLVATATERGIDVRAVLTDALEEALAIESKPKEVA